MNYDRRSSWFWRWLLGGLLCFAVAAVTARAAYTPIASGTYWVVGAQASGTSTILQIYVVYTHNEDGFWGESIVYSVSGGTAQTYNSVSQSASGTMYVTVPVGGYFRATVTHYHRPDGGTWEMLGTTPVAWGNGAPVPLEDLADYRSSPVSFQNPYGFPLTLYFLQDGSVIGSVSVGAGETWTGQIGSNSASDINIRATTPTGYALVDGTLQASGSTQYSWLAGTVSSGESVSDGSTAANTQSVTSGSTTMITAGSGVTTGTAAVSSMATTGGHVAWGSSATGSALTDTSYRSGVEALVDATQDAATKVANAIGSGSGSGASGVDPRANIDAIGTALEERWQAEDEESAKRRAFGDALAERYTEAQNFDASTELSAQTASNPGLSAPGTWAQKTATVSDPSGAGAVSMPGLALMRL